MKVLMNTWEGRKVLVDLDPQKVAELIAKWNDQPDDVRAWSAPTVSVPEEALNPRKDLEYKYYVAEDSTWYVITPDLHGGQESDAEWDRGRLLLWFC